MKIKIFDANLNKEVEIEKVEKTKDEWKKLLTPEQFEVMRNYQTEEPFSKTCPIPPKESGIFNCAACDTALFKYETKFESGTGWPSFFEPVSPLNIVETDMSTVGDYRIEVSCARCGSHLGHVFPDGPPPTGKRYCINCIALN